MLLLIMLGIFLASYAQMNGEHRNQTADVSVKKVNQLTDEQMHIQLAALEPKKSRDEQMSAMCYEMAAPPRRIEYTCPKCGEKTYYYEDQDDFMKSNIESCRIEFRKLSKRKTNCTFTFDESSFCAHCKPDAVSHIIALTVTCPGGVKHTTTPVYLDDFLMLNAFFSDSLSYTTQDGTINQLKTVLDRLSALLGENIDSARYKRIKE
jgi:hypothetical protein